MDLILWRHAEAAESEGESADLDRPLTARGERQAARVAHWLERQLSAGTRVIASPARRARQTAAALDRRASTVEALAPGASAEDVLQAARWPDSREPVLVVGHQPALGLVAAKLLAGTAQPLLLKKGAVWWFRQRKRDGEEGVVLISVRSPDTV
jgi:phosphohistidine phosphatase